MQHSTMRRRVLGTLAVLSLAVLTACGGSDSSSDAEAESDDAAATTSAGPAAAPEPDLDGVPDVVAEVNGEEIAKDDFVQAYEGSFQQAAAQGQQGGPEIDQEALKKETADNLVNQTLLTQAASDAGLKATSKEVDSTLEELATSNGAGGVDEFLTTLESQGLTEEDVRTAVEEQIVVEQFIEDEGDIKEPTDKELKELYDSLSEQQGGGEGDAAAPTIPPLEEVKPQLEQQLTQEKQSAAAEKILEDLRDKGDIKVNL